MALWTAGTGTEGGRGGSARRNGVDIGTGEIDSLLPLSSRAYASSTSRAEGLTALSGGLELVLRFLLTPSPNSESAKARPLASPSA